ncbi:MAG: radical SAM protein, partial [Proteobacteria bacterium]
WSLSPFAIIERRFQKKALEFIETQKTPLPCSALKSSVYLSEKGDVYPCTIWGRKLGSIRETGYDLRSVLKQQLSRDTRSSIKAGNCPQCWTPCEAYPSIMDRGGIF